MRTNEAKEWSCTKKALVIIDVQKDYFKGGRWELYQSEQVLEQIKTLIGAFRAKKFPIVYMQHISPKGAAFFEEGTTGTAIHPEITPQETDSVIIKHYPNSFFKTDLQAVLEEKKIDELYVCGMMSHMCVDTTVRSAKDHGYPVTLFADACATKDLTFEGGILPATTVHKVFMASLNGTFAKVTKTAMIDDLLKE